MMKITTRIFTASALGAMLIGINTGVFACEDHSPAAKTVATKVAAKSAKPVAKTVANAKMSAKAGGVKLASLPVAGAKGATAKAAPMMCPMCAKEHAGEKK